MGKKNKTITLSYCVTFGKGDGSDEVPWDYTLTDAQQEAYEKALADEDIWDPEDVPELAEIPDLVCDEIASAEIENLYELVEEDDEYVWECLGLNPIDEEDLNDLVHSGNKHALEVLELEDKTEEELEAWDASCLQELPSVCMVDENCEPEFPYRLSIYLPEDMFEEDRRLLFDQD